MSWVLPILGILILAIVLLYWRYVKWLEAQTRRASAESKVAQTAQGPVEYDRRGRGPTVLHFHGGNVGHNGWFMIGHLAKAGFTVLTPDRPGYLGTPLADNGSAEAQADLAAALLDTLGIGPVSVVGISAGGASALQFVLRHPQRAKALVLLSGITRRTGLSQEQMNSALGRLVMTPRFQNPAYCLINLAMKWMPRYALQDYVRTETTYDMETGKRLIRQILANPIQKQQVFDFADAIVPARPRFEGVMNDLKVQENLADMPVEQIRIPTLMIHSRHDGDVPYETAAYTHEHIPNAELITVDQFGHLVWWGDQKVTENFQGRMERFLKENG
jgi:pimeloyl-ACP methyl ester carboxylesterase